MSYVLANFIYKLTPQIATLNLVLGLNAKWQMPCKRWSNFSLKVNIDKDNQFGLLISCIIILNVT